MINIINMHGATIKIIKLTFVHQIHNDVFGNQEVGYMFLVKIKTLSFCE